MKMKQVFLAIGLLIGTCGVLQGAQAELVRFQLSASEQEWHNKELFDAVFEGDVERVQDLIAKGANVIARDELGCIPLHYAYYHPAVMQILIKADPGSVNFKSETGVTPLYMAAMIASTYDLPVLEMLLGAGADVEIRSNNGATAVHQAVDRKKDQEIILSTLLACAPEAVDVKHGKTEETPLMWAIRYHRDLVPFLISVGANPDIPNKAGETPRQLAKKLGCEDLLAKRGDTKPARAIFLE